MTLHRIDALLLLVSAALTEAVVFFGPSHCVGLERTYEGSCLLRTDCAGKDINSVEFVFDCEDSQGHVVRHFFGKGGFDANEEFDTEIKCAKCRLPHKKVRPRHAKKAPKGLQAAFVKKLRTKASTPVALSAEQGDGVKADSEAVSYGPRNCVSTWQDSKTGHCMMQTVCSETDISNFIFGLVCIDKQGKAARHLFGKNSFDPEEKFDSLILCDQCLGLDEPGQEQADQAITRSEFSEMKEVMANMSSQMGSLAKSIDKLEEKVFTKNSTSTPKAASPSAANLSDANQSSAKAATLLGKRRHHHVLTKHVLKKARSSSTRKVAHHKAAEGRTANRRAATKGVAEKERQAAQEKAAKVRAAKEKAAKDKVAAEIARVTVDEGDNDEDDAAGDAASDASGEEDAVSDASAAVEQAAVPVDQDAPGDNVETAPQED